MLPRSSSPRWLTSSVALMALSALAIAACTSDDTATPTTTEATTEAEPSTPEISEPEPGSEIAPATVTHGEVAIAAVAVIAPADIRRGDVALAIPVIAPPPTIERATVTKGATSPSATTTTTTTVPATTTTTTTTTTVLPATAIDSCLGGDWTVGDTDRDAYYEAVAVAAGFDSMVVNGSIALTFGEADAHLTRNHDVSITIDDDIYSFRFDGTWTATSAAAADGTITAPGAVFNGAGVTDTRLNGEPIDDIGDLLVGVFSIDPLDGMSYTCDDGTIGLPIGEFGDTQFFAALVAG